MYAPFEDLAAPGRGGAGGDRAAGVCSQPTRARWPSRFPSPDSQRGAAADGDIWPAAAADGDHQPTAQPTATRTPERHDSEPVLPGHLTGTVIDQRTGAPDRRMEVQVGTLIVISDANGNYDVNGLAPGQYTVALRLSAEQGVASQGY